VAAAAAPGERVGVLGLSYKPGTNITEESFGVGLAAWLADRGCSVVVFDPAGNEGAEQMLGPRVGTSVRVAASIDDVLHSCQVLVLATAWPEFAAVEPHLAGATGIHDVFDCWRVVDGPCAPGTRLWRAGVGEPVGDRAGEPARHA